MSFGMNSYVLGVKLLIAPTFNKTAHCQLPDTLIGSTSQNKQFGGKKASLGDLCSFVL